ncbi:MAG: efflux RND transporter periplasmic adaptor subunit [Flavobacteriaceae bacterium]|nr:efflux RND transporter periplasmic adaptor subunit [Flavobacteriaceae bacterium]MCY4266336.1 efflux RND transporter periplasmic adaptor subunit [Flavobacteriaceae bacterium]MCY4299300.1 efflux RND transporter periplasmic adaptor subunit [Flavobacteriaceae bacterium]
MFEYITIQNKVYRTTLLLIIYSFIASCKTDVNKNVKTTNNTISENEENFVETMVIQSQPFSEEIIVNGKLSAEQKSVLKFNVSGNLKLLNVKNGERVQINQVIASLDNYTFNQEVNKAQLNYDKAQLDFQDILIVRGYHQTNKDSIPQNIFEMANIRSGLQAAKNQLNEANHNLNSSILKAPFSGKIGTLKYRLHEFVAAQSDFLTLIDDREFFVEFYLMETEIYKVGIGDDVSVTLLNHSEITEGTIHSINPQVEKNGTVLIKALIKNKGMLLEGMNVQLSIQKIIPNQLVVPKSAVLLRQNEPIIFKYQNGLAQWSYINTIHENSHSYAIIPNPEITYTNLSQGDTIIISNNTNLAHNSPVTIDPKTLDVSYE